MLSAADTNVLVRALTRDDPRQAAAAGAFLAGGAWVSQTAIAELVWVLQSRYRRTRAELIETIDLLLSSPHLALENAPVIVAALNLFRERSRVSFTDCLLLEQARASGHLPLGTFDRELGKAPGAVLLR